MTQSQWGKISFGGSYYRKGNEISFQQYENTSSKIVSTNCALSSNLGTFNVTLPLDHYCFLPFWAENKQTSPKPKNCKMQQIPFLVTTRYRNHLGTFNVTLPLDQYCFLPFWGENKQTSQKPKNCKMQQILFLVTTSFRNLLGSWIQTFYIFHHLFSKRKGL